MPKLGISLSIKPKYGNFTVQEFPPSFDPSTIPNLKAWFSTTYGVNHTSNVIDNWVAKYPADGSVVATAFNGPMLDGDSIYFDGIDSYMTSDDILISNTTPRTFVVVGSMGDAIHRNQEGFINSFGDGGYIFKEALTESMYYYANGFQQQHPETHDLSEFHTIVVRHGISPDPSSIKIGAITSSDLVISNTTTFDTLYIGCREPSSEYLFGRIKNILVFDRILTETEVTDLENYLA